MRPQRSNWKTSSRRLDLSSVLGMHNNGRNKSICFGHFRVNLVLKTSCRLVYDRETGKPKGYGFCEYQDQETALSAMRNLNGREFSGRALRVDNAASEKNKEELKSKVWTKYNILSKGSLNLLFLNLAFDLHACFHRFGDWSSNYWVSLWRRLHARRSPGVHQQGSSQPASRADVWANETDEGEDRKVACSI